jgi:type II secretory pathway pseudopilin PulG
MRHGPRPRRGERGTTLIEALVALTVLLVGLVAMNRLLLFGATSDRASRAQTLANQAARELLTGLTSLPMIDQRLSSNGSGATPPSPFGRLLDPLGNVASSGGYHVWSDGLPIAGVRTDAQLAAGPENAYRLERRWVVWDYVPAGGVANTVRVISVSVGFDEMGRREVVLYGQQSDLGALVLRNVTSG